MKSFAFSTISLLAATAAAAPASDISRRGDAIIYPTALSQYFVSTGAVNHDTHVGRISKLPKWGSDITTLATFNIPAEYAGKQCSLAFELNGPEALLSGSKQFDVFTSLKPATADAATWPSGNLRDQHVGRMEVDPVSKKACFEGGFPTEAKTFPCWTGVGAGELVGVGDQVDIYWGAASKGPHIIVHQ